METRRMRRITKPGTSILETSGTFRALDTPPPGAPPKVDAILVPETMTNREFFERYAAPGRVGLVGMTSWIDRRIKKVQRHLNPQGRWSLWSHALLFEGRRLDGEHWVMECDLDISRGFVRLGVQENRIDKYWDDAACPTSAVLDFHLNEDQVDTVLRAGLELLATRTRYSIPKIFGTWIAVRKKELGKRFVKEDDTALYCSAFVRHCFAKIGIDFAPGVIEDNVAPEHLAASPVPHTMYLMRREGK